MSISSVANTTAKPHHWATFYPVLTHKEISATRISMGFDLVPRFEGYLRRGLATFLLATLSISTICSDGNENRHFMSLHICRYLGEGFVGLVDMQVNHADKTVLISLK